MTPERTYFSLSGVFFSDSKGRYGNNKSSHSEEERRRLRLEEGALGPISGSLAGHRDI